MHTQRVDFSVFGREPLYIQPANIQFYGKASTNENADLRVVCQPCLWTKTKSKKRPTKNRLNTTNDCCQKLKHGAATTEVVAADTTSRYGKQKSLSGLSGRVQKLGHGICPFGKRRQIQAVQCRCGGRSVHGDEVPETNHRYIGLGRLSPIIGALHHPVESFTPFVCSYMRSTQGRYTISGGRGVDAFFVIATDGLFDGTRRDSMMFMTSVRSSPDGGVGDFSGRPIGRGSPGSRRYRRWRGPRLSPAPAPDPAD